MNPLHRVSSCYKGSRYSREGTCFIDHDKNPEPSVRQYLVTEHQVSKSFSCKPIIHISESSSQNLWSNTVLRNKPSPQGVKVLKGCQIQSRRARCCSDPWQNSRTEYEAVPEKWSLSAWCLNHRTGLSNQTLHGFYSNAKSYEAKH